MSVATYHLVGIASEKSEHPNEESVELKVAGPDVIVGDYAFVAHEVSCEKNPFRVFIYCVDKTRRTYPIHVVNAVLALISK